MPRELPDAYAPNALAPLRAARKSLAGLNERVHAASDALRLERRSHVARVHAHHRRGELVRLLAAQSVSREVDGSKYLFERGARTERTREGRAVQQTDFQHRVALMMRSRGAAFNRPS